MTTSRIAFLFPVNYQRTAGDRQRLIDVLTACCLAAKNRAVGEYRQPLTHENNAFSIDEVMENLPVDCGTPTRPEFRRKYKIVEVIATIEDLECDNYVADPDGDFETIRLTDDLFHAIAEEWMYARGARPHRIDDDKVFAQSSTHAHWIAAIRTKNREEVLSC